MFARLHSACISHTQKYISMKKSVWILYRIKSLLQSEFSKNIWVQARFQFYYSKVYISIIESSGQDDEDDDDDDGSR